MLDPQLKRGMIDACVLSVLCSGEAHGYKIIKELSPYIEVSESTLYPVLHRLETAGMLDVHSVEYKGRLRKMYSITLRGQVHLKEFLDSRDEVIGIYDFVRRNSNDQA